MTPPLDRQPLLDDQSLRGIAFCRALSDRVDDWLRRLWTDAEGPATGAALVAVGGYGRAELSPGSDLDVWILHAPRTDVGALAERIWYPVWDAGVKLGHAVRTVKESLSLAADDLDTATAVLSVRHLAGDRSLSDELAEKGLGLWRKRSQRWLEEMAVRVAERHERVGEIAFLLEPDLKDGRGGLRDVHAIRWAGSAGFALHPGDEPAIADAYATVLSTRVELHRRTGSTSDVLVLEEQDAVAVALGHCDADELMRELSRAARTISWVSDDLWWRVRSLLAGPTRRRGRTEAADAATGVSLVEGVVSYSPDADLVGDPSLVLRAAVVAARSGARLSRDLLTRSVDAAAPPIPWDEQARRLFVDLLLAGRPAISVVETLDLFGLWEPIVPEWSSVRCLPQRNAYHRFTVDRHLCETVANAAELADRVDRPDLLVMGALLHDIGKGADGDHVEVGLPLAAVMATRMGFTAEDIATLQVMVEHHLLLPDIATRRDLSDDGTIQYVADRVGSLPNLRLLHALTIADSLATGSAAWGPWKEELVGVLVDRVAHVLAGGSAAEATDDGFPTEHQRNLLAQRRRIIETSDDVLVLVSPDRPGLFSRVAGVLSLSGLTVLEAAAVSDESGMALEQFRVRNQFDEHVAWDRVVRDLERALDGRLALEARLAERSRAYRPPRRLPGLITRTEVLVDNGLSHDATVLEIRARDDVGVLWRITRVLLELDLDIVSAKIQTLGTDVVDSFYVRDASGGKVTDPEHLVEIERALLHSLGR